MKQFALLFALATLFASAAQAQTGGLVPHTIQMDAINQGTAITPPQITPLPLNPSGNEPFALTVDGDVWLGDVYCLAEDVAPWGPDGNGCVYGAAIHGRRVGPVIYQVNKSITTDDGTGGPGIVMWADRPNADGSSNQGYFDIWAWGNGSTDFSNSVNFGNRDSGGNPHRRLRITNAGNVQLPDLAGPGVARVCVDSAGNLFRGSC